MMKEFTGGMWEKFHPITNILVSHSLFIRLVVVSKLNLEIKVVALPSP
jgi:hypothetical protein